MPVVRKQMNRANHSACDQNPSLARMFRRGDMMVGTKGGDRAKIIRAATKDIARRHDFATYRQVAHCVWPRAVIMLAGRAGT
jgi:hypothetical protein